ncbi:hypothetical protein [Desulfobacter latus]|uniref:DUF4760 domain-containing protein n=1 Tax=Desulfobacter latus TaxID=2292 RepID=A0A850T8Y5_9BACT|nr:hypothetical protein [Desulfobacter latus]NWH05675.1 hypothetical protein [Desulfobacter latus]
MYYIYFSFIFILSGLMFLECKRRSLPKWWAAIVFAAPVTTPYFIAKSRKGQSLTLVTIFLVCFSLVTAGEIFIHSKMKSKYKYAKLPPVTQQLIHYSEILKQTNQRLDNNIAEFKHHSSVHSNIDRLEQTIFFISELRHALYDNQAAIKQIVEFVGNHRDFLSKKNLQWVYEIKRFYNNRIVIAHFKSLESYLDNFETLLRFCYRNFDAITKAESTIHLKNYDEYYLRYRRTVESYKRLNVKRIQFQNDFTKRYPEIKGYLPAKRQTETLRLWE